MNKFLVLILFVFIMSLFFNVSYDIPYNDTMQYAGPGCEMHKDYRHGDKKEDAKGVPEPSILLLLAAGILGFGAYRKFKK